MQTELEGPREEGFGSGWGEKSDEGAAFFGVQADALELAGVDVVADVFDGDFGADSAQEDCSIRQGAGAGS